MAGARCHAGGTKNLGFTVHPFCFVPAAHKLATIPCLRAEGACHRLSLTLIYNVFIWGKWSKDRGEHRKLFQGCCILVKVAMWQK